ncbi:MAG: OmpA family protein [Sphingobacterium composti]|uniref:OmpA family protein n=1 Tax=Sphingobacterium composti TaxID=363260 RepID=UPI001356D464|nr:OmpA family protein [Sphingobacterium composti Ten et al. 2007 non Yoo et al. 2007]
MKKILVFSVLAGLMSLNSCKQQQLTVLPGAVVSKDGTDDGLKNVKGDFNDATRTDEGIKFSLSSDVLFPSNSSYLTDKAKAELDKLTRILRTQSDKKIRVDGHTDATGEVNYNVWLSEKRAASVKKFLEDAGITASRITTKGLGPNNPIADNKTAEGRQKNRRVEIIILN